MLKKWNCIEKKGNLTQTIFFLFQRLNYHNVKNEDDKTYSSMCLSSVCSVVSLVLRQLLLCVQQLCAFCVSMSASGLWCNWIGPIEKMQLANVAFCNAEIVFYHNDPIGLLWFDCTWVDSRVRVWITHTYTLSLITLYIVFFDTWTLFSVNIHWLASLCFFALFSIVEIMN